MGLGYYRKFNEQDISLMDARKDLGSAQLRSMKMQLHPHFLFNAFNTIVMMIRGRKNQEAVEMISGLSDMLRQSLSRESAQFVTLREEIELLKKYLMIEAIRYRDRLNIVWDIDEECLKYRVPGFVLQPIVENAFKHGISKNPGNSEIKISVGEEAGTLLLSVFNSRSMWSGDWQTNAAPGIGLTNTVQRLTKLYKGGFKLLINQHTDGVNVNIRLPAEYPVDDDPTGKV
jgi:LytS/YehU family sensor histidine kinase